MESYEKEYKKLKAGIKNAYLYAQTDSTKAVLENILPELKESEDEKVRKTLIEYFDAYPKDYFGGLKKSYILAWLEKQGQTFTKRDVDDAYVEGMAFAKNELEKQGEQKPVEWGEEDENTIKVLMNIIRKSEIIDSIIYTDSLKEKLYDWLKSLKDRVQPKQEWNKGDMEMLNAAISFVELSSFTTIGKGKNNTVAWLKSLKSRVIPQSRQEWGKEDETKMHAALAFIKSEFPKKGDEEIMEDTIEWLKSLKTHKTWKPSKGQLECLGYAIDKAEKDYSPLANNRVYLTLKALKKELEKLTE